jgi:hypothetical protein
MKKALIIFAIIFSAVLNVANAQAPQAFSYQAVARDASGNILPNQTVSFRISILQNSTSGTIIYSETHLTITNDFGLVNLKVGQGSVVTGTFSTISWGGNNHFIRVEMDAAGGTSYQLMGTTQLLSVPYALYAEKTSGFTIVSTVDNGNGTFTFNYSDGSSFTTSNLTGAAGTAGTTGQNVTEVYGSGQLLVSGATTTYTLIPGLTQTITVPSNCKVYVYTSGGMQLQVATATAYAAVNFGIFVDGVVASPAGQQLVTVVNTTGLGNNLATWSFGHTFTLTAGSHTFTVRAQSADAGSSTVGVSSGSAAMIQGTLTVMIVKL